jgi:hypothetical protein
VKSEFDVSGLRDLPKVDIVYSYIQPSTRLSYTGTEEARTKD